VVKLGRNGNHRHRDLSVSSMVESVLKTTEARQVYRGMKLFFAEPGGNAVLEKTVLTRLALPFAEDAGLLRKQIGNLTEPLDEGVGTSLVLEILTKFLIQAQHEGLLQTLKNGGPKVEHLERNARDLDRLRGVLWGATLTGEVPRSLMPLADFTPRSDEPGDRLPTHLHSELDRSLGGGLRRKEVGLLVAPSNHGKTASLLRMATLSAQAGLKVFYMSFEIYLEQIHARVKTMVKKIPKTLIAEEYDSDSMTAEQVAAVATKVKPDVLLVDYLDLLRFDALDLVQAQGAGIRQLRNFARKNEAVVWTAAQADEPYEEQMYLKRDQLYGSRQKMHATDVAIGALYLPRRQVQTFVFWKTRHARMGLTFSHSADFVAMKFKELNV
jgi:hypothetical protein